ncbi:hypothetical protein [Microbacterium sp.]|jgi:hypothetical protein|uniref:hypothetical protein n=1 Tax=Microbacterium sp. TaxID=51671 RepID=UPI0037C9FAA9
MSHPAASGIKFDPTLRINGRAITARQVSARTNVAPAARFRDNFIDRLNLPESATNEQIYAAVDALKQARPTPSAQTAEDALYESIFGSAKPTPPTPEDAVYASMFGA